jgi:hypothetical protein
VLSNVLKGRDRDSVTETVAAIWITMFKTGGLIRGGRGKLLGRILQGEGLELTSQVKGFSGSRAT